MTTEAKPTDRTDALVAAIVLGALGLLWVLLRLTWQGLLLLAAAGLLAYLGVLRQRGAAAPPPEEAPTERPAAKPRRTRKRKRKK